MTFNLIAGFIIPWIFGIYLYFKDRRTLLTIVPLGSAIGLLYNSIGFHIPFWKLQPLYSGRVSFLPFDIGLYPILSSYLIYFIKSDKFKNYKLILVFTLVTTIAEFIMLLSGKVFYYNGWNIYWTFISYLIPYITCYLYYLILKKNDL